MPSLRRRLFAGTVYTLALILVVQLISLITSVIYARLLGRANLGVLAILTQLSAAIMPLSTLGLGTAITKMIPEYRKKNPEDLESLLSSAFVVTCIAGLAVSVAYFLLADNLAALYGVPELLLLIRLSAGMVVFDALLNLAAALVQGFQRVKELAILGLVAKGVTVPVIFYMTLTWGLLGAVLAGIVSLALNLAIYLHAGRAILRSEQIRFSLSWLNLRTATKVLRIGLPLFVALIVLRPALLFQSSYLALQVGYAELGLFRVASSLYRMVLLLPAALTVPLLPAISEMYSEKARDHTRGQLSSLIRIATLLSLPITLAVGLGSGPIIELLFGPEFLAASPLVFVMSAAAFVDTIGSITENTLLGTGRTLQVLLLTFMQAIIVVLASFFFIAAFGLLGIGFAVLLNAIVYTVVVGSYFMLRREISFRGLRSSLALATVAFALASFIVLLGGLNNLVVSAVFLAGLSFVVFNLLSERDRSVLRDALKGLLKGGEP